MNKKVYRRAAALSCAVIACLLGQAVFAQRPGEMDRPPMEYFGENDGVPYFEEELYEEEYVPQENIGQDDDADLFGETEPERIRSSEEEDTIEDFEIAGKEEAEEVFILCSIEELPDYVSLDVPEVLQNPELPTGCESVALTMALMYEGFELEKTTIAREFLIYNRETDNTAVGYVGDPFTEEGAGCFAPAIAATADAFFEDQEYDYTAYDISDSSLDELLCYVASGTPVVVWSTMYMAEPEFTRESSVFMGKVYEWYRQEHCVVLSGYDLEEQTLQINDPLEGTVIRDMEEFRRIYNLTGQNAVVVRENAAEDTEEEFFTFGDSHYSTEAGVL